MSFISEISRRFPQLKRLDLSRNNISKLPATMDLPQLEFLSLDDNFRWHCRVVEFPPSLTLPKLRILRLGENEDSLDFIDFNNFPSLKDIYGIPPRLTINGILQWIDPTRLPRIHYR